MCGEMAVRAGPADARSFHAWQAALAFAALALLQMLLVRWAVVLWSVFALDVVAALALARRAWRDAETLERFELPLVGALASRFLDDE
jgi:uncharacterized membrane protein